MSDFRKNPIFLFKNRKKIVDKAFSRVYNVAIERNDIMKKISGLVLAGASILVLASCKGNSGDSIKNIATPNVTTTIFPAFLVFSFDIKVPSSYTDTSIV